MTCTPFHSDHRGTHALAMMLGSSLALLIPAAAHGIPFTDIQAGLPPASMSQAAWGDYDGDGDLDLLLIGLSAGVRIASIYDNDGAGGFTENPVAGLEGVEEGAAEWGDYDGDGDLDLLIQGAALSGSILRVYENVGDGSFTGRSLPGPPGLWGGDVAWGDYDGDGDLDLLATGSTGGSPFSRLYRNQGGGTFELDAGSTNLEPVYWGTAAWGDYDNDGDLDLFLSGYRSSAWYGRLYDNDGTGVMSTNWTAGLPGLATGDAAWGDYEGIGVLHVAVVGDGASGEVGAIYHNLADGTFAPGPGFDPVAQSSVAWGDYDNDGDLDLLYCGWRNDDQILTRIRRNNGDRTFSVDGEAVLSGNRSGSVAWGDYDGDGDLDVVLTGYNPSTQPQTIIYENGSTVANTAPAAPGDLGANRSGQVMSFAWGSGSDLETATAGLSYNLRVGTSRRGSEIVAPMADLDTGFRQVVGEGNRGRSHGWQMEGLQRAWYWSVQTVDQGYLGSAFAPVDSILYMPLLLSVQDVPADQGGWLRLRLRASDLDDASVADLPIATYNLWRRLDDAALAKTILTEGRQVPAKGGLPAATVAWQGRLFATGAVAEVGVSQLPAGVWEIVGSFAAGQLPEYRVVAPTLADSSSDGTPWSVFVVSAHTSTPSTWFASPPDSGYSVDNLAPAVPEGLCRVSADLLAWSSSPDEDFQYFTVYGSASDHLDGGQTLIAHTVGTSQEVVGLSYRYFLVTATDCHGNESPAAFLDVLTGVAETPPRFALRPCVPNPFNPSTTIRFELPQACRIDVRVYDLAGRLVRVLVAGEQTAAGRHELLWRGGDESGRRVAAGTYFCRLEAGSFRQTRRMTLLK